VERRNNRPRRKLDDGSSAGCDGDRNVAVVGSHRELLQIEAEGKNRKTQKFFEVDAGTIA
jgi:hypothetical protein